MTETVTSLGCYLVQPVESLDKAEYEIVRNSILKNLLAHGAMTFTRLGILVEEHLKKKYYGSLRCYYEIVQQDLEARGEIWVDRNVEPNLIEIAA